MASSWSWVTNTAGDFAPRAGCGGSPRGSPCAGARRGWTAARPITKAGAFSPARARRWPRAAAARRTAPTAYGLSSSLICTSSAISSAISFARSLGTLVFNSWEHDVAKHRHVRIRARKFWNTSPMPRFSGGTRVVTFSSPNHISPSSGASRPASYEQRVVDFPHPEGPSRPTNSPSFKSRLRSLTATTEPKRLVKCRSLTSIRSTSLARIAPGISAREGLHRPPACSVLHYTLQMLR